MTRQLPDADLIISLPRAARPGLVYNADTSIKMIF